MKLIKSLLEHNKIWFVLALCWTGIVGYYCLVNPSSLPTFTNLPPYFDKFVHICFHIGITFLWFLYFKSANKSKSVNQALMSAFLFSLFYGIVIEACQSMFTTNRTADVLDVLANSFGAVTVVFFISLLQRIRKRKK